MMGGENSDQCFDDAGRRVELPTLLALGTGELPKKVFINLPQHVTSLSSVSTKADSGHEVNQLSELVVRQLCTSIAFVQNALELGVLHLYDHQCLVYAHANVGLFGGST